MSAVNSNAPVRHIPTKALRCTQTYTSRKRASESSWPGAASAHVRWRRLERGRQGCRAERWGPCRLLRPQRVELSLSRTNLGPLSLFPSLHFALSLSPPSLIVASFLSLNVASSSSSSLLSLSVGPTEAERGGNGRGGYGRCSPGTIYAPAEPGDVGNNRPPSG